MYVITAPNVVLVGDPEVGKSTLISKCHQYHPSAEDRGYFTHDFQIPCSYKPTALRSYLTSIYLNQYYRKYVCTYSVFLANLIDTGGRSYYDDIRPLAYMNADVLLVCFDLSNRTSFSNVTSKWLPEIKKYEPRTPVILVGTKSDLKARQVTEAEIDQTRSALGLDTYIETTSYCNEGKVSTLFEKAVEIAFAYQKCQSKARSKRSKHEHEGQRFDVTTLEIASDPPEYPKGSSTLSDDWQATLHSKRTADVILTFADQSPDIHAHTFVLSLASTAFRELFKSMDIKADTTGLKNSSFEISGKDSDQLLLSADSIEDCTKCCCLSINSENGFQENPSILKNKPFAQVKCSHCRDEKDVVEEESMITKQWSQSEAFPIEITFKPSIKRPVFLCVLEWMYTGKLDISEETELSFIKDLQTTISELDIKPLKLLWHRQRKRQNITSLPPGKPTRPPPLPPLLPSARRNNQVQHGDIPIPPPLPPLLPSARGVQQVHLNQLDDGNIQLPPPQTFALNETIHQSQCSTDKVLSSKRFKTNIVSAYKSMWENAHGLLVDEEVQTDLVLIVGETALAVHRVVLITRSSVMAAMLDGKFKEKDFKTVKLPGVSLNHFRTVLQFMYTDTCVLDETNVQLIMELADRFNIPSLLERCVEYMIHIMEYAFCYPKDSLETAGDLVMETIYLSETFNAPLLNKWCLHFIATNHNLFAQQQEDVKRIWSQNEEYMESNRWPTPNHIKALENYKASKRKKIKTSSMRTTKCRCCVM